MTNTQANHIRALVSDAGTQVNPTTGNSETQTRNIGSTSSETQTRRPIGSSSIETQTMTNRTTSQGTGTEQASSPMETQTDPPNTPQVFDMAVFDRQDEGVERTNQIIQDTINTKIKKEIKKTEISDT